MSKQYYSNELLADLADHEPYCNVRQILTTRTPDNNFGYSIKDAAIDCCGDDEILDAAVDMMQDWYENNTTGCKGADRICQWYHDYMMRVLRNE